MNERSDLSEDERALLALVPEDGSTKTNPSLRDELGWGEDRYYRTRDLLEDKGLLERWRGRGGTVRRPVSQGDSRASASAEVCPEEEALYDPMLEVIKADWARANRIDPIAVERTDRAGGRRTGDWSRPDVVSVEIRTFEYLPDKSVEVTTFEIKPCTAINTKAVFEALSHRRAATRSYVLLHAPNELATGLESQIDEVVLLAREHGIGVIVAADPSDYDTWDEREFARRVEPEPERLNAFISQQLSAEARRKLSERRI